MEYIILTKEKEKIIRKYHALEKSDTFIAKLIGYKSGESVRQYRLKHNLKSNGQKSLEVFDRDTVDKLFKEGKTYTEIANLLNVAQNTLSAYFWKKNGKLPSEKRQAPRVEPTQLEKEVIFGTMLGDGSLRLPEKAKNSSGKIEHGLKQEKYVKYKYKFLKRLSTKLYYYTRPYFRKPETNQESVYFTLKTNPALTEIYHNFYKNNKKVIPEDLSLLTPLALAMLYMDDGSKTQCGYLICTNCFTVEDVNRLRKYLRDIYDLETTINKQHMIYIRSCSKELFKQIVLPFMHKSMLYKL